jgi:hypothetical protein
MSNPKAQVTVAVHGAQRLQAVVVGLADREAEAANRPQDGGGPLGNLLRDPHLSA